MGASANALAFQYSSLDAIRLWHYVQGRKQGECIPKQPEKSNESIPSGVWVEGWLGLLFVVLSPGCHRTPGCNLLLANTKATEKRIEDVVGVNRTRDHSYFLQGDADFAGHHFVTS